MPILKREEKTSKWPDPPRPLTFGSVPTVFIFLFLLPLSHYSDFLFLLHSHRCLTHLSSFFIPPFFSCDMFESSIRHTLKTQWNWKDMYWKQLTGFRARSVTLRTTPKKKEKWKVGARRGESYCNLCAA